MAAKKRAALKQQAKKMMGKAKAKAGAMKAKARATVAKKKKVAPIPAAYRAITPSIVVRGATDAIAFYQKAFGAKPFGGVMKGPDGKVMHAEFKIGDSVVMIGDEYPEMGSKAPQTLGGSPASLLIYTKDVDAMVARAVEAGAKVTMPVADQFWGDRYGRVMDPFGHDWQIATHVEDVSPKEMMKRMAAMASQQPPPMSAQPGTSSATSPN